MAQSPPFAGADQEARDLLDRLLRGREADAQQTVAAERGKALEREREMAAALVRRDAWISSTITVRVVASILRPDSEPSRM